ncbi:NEAT domain-containing protein [Paenibacillus konkukensis]|uniref:NEAT domain-containing protein n=1 Tax=Paenibacillus konkukensis TaxID=2020716 RepID=UPI00201D5531|nr:NEAT domain-containing protein [Paenibacillus konkukensis]
MLFVLLGTIHIPATEAAGGSVVKMASVSDSVYADSSEESINFMIYKKGTNEPSVMYDYVDPNSGKLIVQNGKQYVSFTLKQSAEITSFKTMQNGALAETSIVSGNKAANTRVVQFAVDDLNARLTGWVKIYWQLTPDFLYDKEYDVELGFSKQVVKTALNAAIADAQAKHDAAVEGTEAGQYPAGAKATLLTAIGQAKAVADNAAATQAQVDAATAALQAAVTAFQASVNTGSAEQYDLNFTALHETEDKASSMDRYFVKPGKLTVQQGQKKVTLTITDHQAVPSFQVEQNGAMVETTVISVDTVANKRVVQFPIEDLAALLNAKVHVSAKMPNGSAYENDYIIRLKFDVGNKTTLNAAIADAQAKHDAAVEGTEAGQYPVGAKATLLTAIGQAKAVADNAAATQAQVDAATAALQAAVTAFQASVNTGSAEQYDLNFTALHETEDKASSMDRYFVKPGKLTVQQGQKKVTLTITDHQAVPSFQVEQNGAMVETTVISVDTVANKRVVQFPIEDLAALLNAKVHVSAKMPNGSAYENDYIIRLKFDVGNKTTLNAAIADAQAKHDAAVEGTEAGQYPAGAKSTLLTAIGQAKAVADNAAATQAQVDAATAALQAAVTAFQASVIKNNSGTGTIPDGEYMIDYTIYKKGTDENSVMYDYVDPASGKLTVEGGKKYVSFKLKQSAEIKSFQTEQNGALEEAKTVSSDEAGNTRVVRFEVSDLTKRLNGWVKIYWQVTPEFLYDHEYDVELGFGDISVDFTKPLKDGEYQFSYQSEQVAGKSLSDFVEPSGGLKIQNNKKVAYFKLKSGVTVKKIQRTAADGSKQDITPQYAAKETGLVRVLASDASAKEVQFEVEDLTSTYSIELQSGDGEAAQIHQFDFSFNKVVFVSASTDEGNTGGENGNGNGNGNGSGNSGGGTGGGSSGGGGGGGSTGSSSSSLSDGQYTVNFMIKKYGTDERSVMQDYVISPGVLTVDAGQKYFSFTLKQSKEITSFKTMVDGGLAETQVINRSEEKNTRDVQFPVTDLSSRLKGWVKVDWAEFNYFHTYDVEIAFDLSSAKKIKGTAGLLGGGAGAVVASLKNGEYDLDFTALQYRNNLESKVNDYVAHPAKLIVKDDKRYVSITINKQNEISDFRVEVEKTKEATDGSTNSDGSPATVIEKAMEGPRLSARTMRPTAGLLNSK